METVLTAQERHEVVTVLRQLDPQAPPEQRREPRRKALLNLLIRKIAKNGSNAAAKAVLVNVSVKGIGMLTKAVFAKTDKFAVALRFDEGGGWLVLCEVRNCKSLANGHYKVGARFIDRIEDPSGDAKIPGDWQMYGR